MVEEPIGFAEVRFTRDWRRIQCLDPDAYLEMLQAVEASIGALLRDVEQRGMMLRKLEESLSNTIQLSPIRGCLTDNPEKEFRLLASLYCDAPASSRTRETKGRQLILNRMAEAFEHAGLKNKLSGNSAMSAYTHPGDRLRLDFGYRTKHSLKFSQAISLESSETPAILFAGRFPELARQIAFAARLPVFVTAVVDGDVATGDERKKFALDYLRGREIKVANVSLMQEIAELAKEEILL